MLPIQTLFEGKMTIIRPMVLVEEKQIDRFAQEKGLPVSPSGCPSSGKTKRIEMKDLIESLEKTNPRIKGETSSDHSPMSSWITHGRDGENHPVNPLINKGKK